MINNGILEKIENPRWGSPMCVALKGVDEFSKPKSINEDQKESIITWQDDILLMGNNLKEMFDLVNEVMNKLDRINLRIKKEKMKLFKRSLTFLGYEINSTERKICKERLNSFKDLREPRTKKELESIQGLLSYYGSFMPTLYKYKDSFDQYKKLNKFKLSEKEKENFQNIKNLLTTENSVCHYRLDLPLILATDASEHSTGGTLFHKFEVGTTRQIFSAAKRFNEHELKYDIANKEALNSRALYCIHTSKKGIGEKNHRRLARYRLALAEYDFVLKLISSNQNSIPNILSRMIFDGIEKDKSLSSRRDEEYIISQVMVEDEVRILESKAPKYIDIGKLVETSRESTIVNKVIKCLKHEEKWEKNNNDKEYASLRKRKYDLDQIGNVLLVGEKIYIPKEYRSEVLTEVHKSHDGIGKMLNNLKEVFWSKKYHDVGIKVQKCSVCQVIAPRPKKKHTNWPENVSRTHMDFMDIWGCSILLMVESTSTFVSGYVLNNKCAKSVVKKLHDYRKEHGKITYLINDNAPHFVNGLIDEFCAKNETIRMYSPPYIPECNGFIKTYVRIVKNKMKKRTEEMKLIGISNKSLVKRILNDVIIQLRETPKKDNKTPRELFARRFEIDEETMEFSPKDNSFQKHDKVWYYHKNKGKWMKAVILEVISFKIVYIQLESLYIMMANRSSLKIRKDLLDIDNYSSENKISEISPAKSKINLKKKVLKLPTRIQPSRKTKNKTCYKL
uniref:RNA-directed DNA polymerase n=1 Tax=Strongyloides venezuelensis TaxID=75913 RepID=A0A0K0FRW8_STRVS